MKDTFKLCLGGFRKKFNTSQFLVVGAFKFRHRKGRRNASTATLSTDSRRFLPAGGACCCRKGEKKEDGYVIEVVHGVCLVWQRKFKVQKYKMLGRQENFMRQSKEENRGGQRSELHFFLPVAVLRMKAIFVGCQ